MIRVEAQIWDGIVTHKSALSRAKLQVRSDKLLEGVGHRQVMQILREVQERISVGLILIGHDIGLMAQSVDEIAVLRKGDLVENSLTRQVLEAPKYSYAQELMSSVPLISGPSFLGAQAKVPDVTPEAMPLLDLHGVSKVYGDVPALHSMSFKLDGAAPKIISNVG